MQVGKTLKKSFFKMERYPRNFQIVCTVSMNYVNKLIL